MRKTLPYNFNDLVNENKEELMDDPEILRKVEEKLEKKQQREMKRKEKVD